MGEIWLATDTNVETEVIIKVVRTDKTRNENFINSFRKEARIQAFLKHSGIPHVIDFFDSQNQYFLVMEKINGESLEEKLKQSRQNPQEIDTISLEKILDWANQLLEILEFIHQINIYGDKVIHRDIKPANIIISDTGKVKLIDFGIAKGNIEDDKTDVDSKTLVAKSAPYASIEQILTDNAIANTIASFGEVPAEKVKKIKELKANDEDDIYSLGVVLYQLIVGERPKPANERAVPYWKDQIDPIEPIGKDIPDEIKKIIMKSLAIEREDRYSSAFEMRRELISFKENVKQAEINKLLEVQEERLKELHQKEIDSLLGEKTRLIEEKTKLEKDKTNFKKDIEVINKEKDDIKTDLENQKAESFQMLALVIEKDSVLQSLESAKDELKKKRDELQEKFDESKKDRQRMESQIELLQSEIRINTGRIASSQNQTDKIDELSNELKKVKKIAKDLFTEKKKIENQLKEKQNTIDNLVSELKEKEEKIEEVKEKLKNFEEAEEIPLQNKEVEKEPFSSDNKLDYQTFSNINRRSNKDYQSLRPPRFSKIYDDGEKVFGPKIKRLTEENDRLAQENETLKGELKTYNTFDNELRNPFIPSFDDPKNSNASTFEGVHSKNELISGKKVEENEITGITTNSFGNTANSSSNSRSIDSEKSNWIAQNTHNFTYIGLFLFTVVLFFRPIEWIPNFISVNSVLLILSIISFFVYLYYQRQSTVTVTIEIIAVLVMTGLGLLTIPFSQKPDVAWDKFLFFFISLVPILIILVNVVDSLKRMRLLIWVGVLAGIMSLWYTFSKYMQGELQSSLIYQNPVSLGTLGNSNEIAILFVVLVPTIISFGVLEKRVLSRSLYFIFSIMFLFGLILIQSQMAFLAMTVSSGVLFWKLKYHSLSIITGIVFLGAIIITPLSCYYAITALFSLETFKYSIIATLRHPLGLGLGNYLFTSPTQMETFNTYTQISSEIGWLGLTAYLIFLISPLLKLADIERQLFSAKNYTWVYFLAIGLQASIIGYIIASFFISVAYHWFIYYLIAYSVCLDRIHIIQQSSLENTDDTNSMKFESA